MFSTLFAGLLADWMGRKPLMILSGIAFVISIPVIALSQSYASLFFGRLLQGVQRRPGGHRCASLPGGVPFGPASADAEPASSSGC